MMSILQFALQSCPQLTGPPACHAVSRWPFCPQLTAPPPTPSLPANALLPRVQSPYIHFIALLVHSHFSRPIILLEFRDISMRFCLRAQDVDSVATATAEVCCPTSCTHAYENICTALTTCGTKVLM